MSMYKAEPRVVMVGRMDSRTTGLGRYVYSLADAYAAAGLPARLSPPLVPPFPARLYDTLHRCGVDLRTFLSNYPVRADLRHADIVHVTSQNLAALLTVRRSRPSVVTVHDLWWLAARRQGHSIRGGELAGERLALLGLRQAYQLIAISEHTRRTIVDLLGYPEERVSVIHRAVDTARFRPGPIPADLRARLGLPAGGKIVLYVGSEDPRKNLGVLLEAFGLIAGCCREAVLVKAGAVHFPDEAARLRMRAEQLGLGGRCLFYEDLSDDDLPALYTMADVCVVPSLFEGFGLPALEAMACGRPVVAANATSLPEVVGESGILFAPHSPQELAHALIGLLDAPERRQALGAAARERALSFSLERQAAQTWEVYRRAYAGARRAGQSPRRGGTAA